MPIAPHYYNPTTSLPPYEPPLDTGEIAAELGKRYRKGGKPFSRKTIFLWRKREGMPHNRSTGVTFQLTKVLHWAERKFSRCGVSQPRLREILSPFLKRTLKQTAKSKRH